jgi:hypothetical protein
MRREKGSRVRGIQRKKMTWHTTIFFFFLDVLGKKALPLSAVGLIQLPIVSGCC